MARIPRVWSSTRLVAISTGPILAPTPFIAPHWTATNRWLYRESLAVGYGGKGVVVVRHWSWADFGGEEMINGEVVLMILSNLATNKHQSPLSIFSTLPTATVGWSCCNLAKAKLTVTAQSMVGLVC